MRVRILGSAAGGGLPQWNCGCSNCAAARSNNAGVAARTQSSIAVSGDDRHWLLVNASPDIRQQIIDNPPLHPRGGVRSGGIAAVVLVDSQIDHVTGLLLLWESQEPLPIYCSERTEADLRSGLPVLETLRYYCGSRVCSLPVDGTVVEPPETPGVRFTPVPLTSKAPPYSRHRDDPRAGDNLGLFLEDPATGKGLFYAPGLG